jgi:hypothetical protein
MLRYSVTYVIFQLYFVNWRDRGWLEIIIAMARKQIKHNIIKFGTDFLGMVKIEFHTSRNGY